MIPIKNVDMFTWTYAFMSTPTQFEWLTAFGHSKCTTCTHITYLNDIQSSPAISPSVFEYSSYRDQVCSYCVISFCKSSTAVKSGLDSWKCSASSLYYKKNKTNIPSSWAWNDGWIKGKKELTGWYHERTERWW